MNKMKRLLMAGGLAIMLLALILVVSGTATARNTDAAAANISAENGIPGFFMTGPNAGEPLDIALSYIGQYHAALGLSAADVAGLVVSDMYRSEHNGVTHIYLQQQKDGILVFNAYLNVNIAADGSVINLGNRAVSNLDRAIETAVPTLSAAEAIEAAADHLGLTISEPLVAQEVVGGPDQRVVFNDAGIAVEQIPARLMYQPVADGSVRLAWDLEIYERSTVDWWTMRVDAQTGEVLSQLNYVVHENSGEAEGAVGHDVHSGSSELANLQGELVPESYNIFAIPKESPYDGPRTLELNPFDINASPYGWHDTNGVAGPEFTVTAGNNVYADSDLDANNVPDGNSPDGTAALVFDFPLDFNLDPLDYLSASITNLFYMNNIMHDVTYQYGFDEVAGNFQENNYGNGGLGSDSVNADALDGSGTNNANFGTPPDGSNPRMQMFRWTNPFGQLVTVNSPPIGGPFVANPSNNGGTANGLTADVVIVVDGVAPTNDACETVTNDLTGKIALIEWSAVCNSSVFVQNAANAGAVAAIIIDATDSPLTNFGGSAAIPSVAIGNADGMLIQNTIIGGQTVNATIDDNPVGAPDRDSDMDNGIIAHEYGHGISNRLTGGPSTASCLGNEEQMGEGWSDFWTLVLSAVPGDTATLPRGIGNYSQFNDPNGGGIRLFPYTTDMSVNPQTYDSIKTNGTSPHSLGEVWMAMVWEVYWNLVDKYGFDPDFYNGTGGNNLTIQLVIDGMKLQPCLPGFVDGRDAILAADMALGGQNQCEIWFGFAKRGLGFSADQGSSSSRTDGTEAFDLPGFCAYLTATPLQQNVCAGSSIDYIVDVGPLFTAPVDMAANNVPAGASASFSVDPVPSVPSTTTLTIDTTAGLAPGNYTIDIQGTDVNTTTTFPVEMDVYNTAPTTPNLTAPADGATNQYFHPFFDWDDIAGVESYLIEVATDAAFSNIVHSATIAESEYQLPIVLDAGSTYYWRVTADNVCGSETSAVFDFTTVAGTCSVGSPTVIYSEDFDSGTGGWTGDGTWALSTASPSPGSGGSAYHAEDLDGPGDQALVSPQITLPSSADELTLQFLNEQNFEDPLGSGGCWDGGILEISTDGTNWTQLDAELQSDPYDGVGDNGPPAGVNMWCGLAGGEQPWLNSIVDISDYLGETVRFRYRLLSDAGAGAEGWYIDDFTVQACGEVSIEYKTYLPIVMTQAENAQAAPNQQSSLPVNGLLLLPAMVGIGLIPYLRLQKKS